MSETKKLAVILAAGKGTRMRSKLPKVLHRMCGASMLELVLSSVNSAGFNHSLVVIPEANSKFLDNKNDYYDYVVQKEPLGTGHALLQAVKNQDDYDNLLVLSGDNPLIKPNTLEILEKYHVSELNVMTILTTEVSSDSDFGRIIRDSNGNIKKIIEFSENNNDLKCIKEGNSGIYCFQVKWLKEKIKKISPSLTGEIFLTDLVEIAYKNNDKLGSLKVTDSTETLGVNNRVQLSQATKILQNRIQNEWLMAGVSIEDPATVYIDINAKIGEDTIIKPNTHINGTTFIGEKCQIGPNTIIKNSLIGNSCKVVSSVVNDSTVEEHVLIGPYSNVRGESYICREVHIGTSVEVNRTHLGEKSKISHFAYVGDAEIGINVNIGAGTVTCNYDGEEKHKTLIRDNSFIGSGTMLIAPVTIGRNAITGAGAVVKEDVEPNTTVVGVPAKVIK
ncbi:MAG: UDP-N-acetylglucosamine diphosphorylase/glucosamine-1-phosphate N-acetyltransferase [Chloroflexi bacterium]|nr:UDP-N-acetylglucosamine diphosphorylase/glucosamine-1-phosphate N-acetyltransferase [Chloroflexota bacterium]MQG05878.1 UDP-N-acetylglucosamine diphosphorylase/glucosamine-1-phosphate N-acetyltransferase [SAR202 cluster bacterium]|tara:strand:+ start:728 stop:2068 length:1341 start_codon:yes stop_codon:yes gene_type:complete